MEKREAVTRSDQRPEERLFIYWKGQLHAKSFSYFLAVIKRAESGKLGDMQEAVNVTSRAIAIGQPLTFHEYHLAIALGWLVGALPDYETFFTKRWHETDTHAAYGAASACSHCKADKTARK